jgi:hypothetical protein
MVPEEFGVFPSATLLKNECNKFSQRDEAETYTEMLGVTLPQSNAIRNSQRVLETGMTGPWFIALYSISSFSLSLSLGCGCYFGICHINEHQQSFVFQTYGETYRKEESEIP